MRRFIVIVFIAALGISACTEESRNRFFRSADNVLGKDLKVSYVADGGQIVKTWTIRDGKVTTQKDANGNAVGYYFFWSQEVGYVQIPIARTIIEELKNTGTPPK